MAKRHKTFTVLKANKFPSKAFLIFISMFLLLTSSYFLFRFAKLSIQPKTYEECIAQPQSRVLERYPALCVTKYGLQFEQPVTLTSPAIRPQPKRAFELPKNTQTGMRIFTSPRFTIEIPENWYIIGDTIFTDSLLETAYGDPYQNNLQISLGDLYGKYKWSDITSQDTFFDLQSNLWKSIMRESGGGGLLQTTVEKQQLAGQTMIKRANTWTKTTEGFDKEIINYFMPDASSKTPLRVWDISYSLPLQGENIANRKLLIANILSSLTFTP